MDFDLMLVAIELFRQEQTRADKRAYAKKYYKANRSIVLEKQKPRSARTYSLRKREILARQKKWKNSNKTEYLERSKRYCAKYKATHPGATTAATRKWYEANKHIHAERWSAERRAYRRSHPKAVARSERKRRARIRSVPSLALASRLRSSLSTKLRSGKFGLKTVEFLGCTFDELKAYLEARFRPGMSWANWGKFGWHIDHRTPVTAFNLDDPNQAAICFHYSNLQPLWWRENISKSDKILTFV